MKIVMTYEQYLDRVDQSAKEINEYYASKGIKKLICVGILKGACFFFADLVRKLDADVIVDFICIDNGGGGIKGKTPIMRLDIDTNITDEHVLIIDDCSDRNATLKFANGYLALKKPASIENAVMITKSGHPENDGKLFIRFQGFPLGPNFIAGCGLDDDGGINRNKTFVYETENQ
jgi:hypoxanthine phosphoribosyltransferase